MNNIFKKGFYIIAVLFLSIATSCEDDDTQVDEIKGLDFVIATLNLEGTKIGVVPTTVNSNNRIIYSVDFGTTSDVDTDNLATSGPMVTFDYPNEDGAYTITVTASLQGTDDVSITKAITITEYIAPVTGPTGPSSPVVGTWRIAPEAAAFGVGPEKDNVSWFANSEADIATRACFFDDEYIFNEDGSFQNVLGADSYIEGWQGTTPDACATPVFPHDGTASATYTYNAAAGTVTIDGKGAFLGLAKVINGAEIASPAEAAESITYIAVITGNTMDLDIEVAGGGFWSFKLVKDAPVTIAGTWKIAPEAAAFGVGPEKDNVSWFANSEEDITTRACFFDDEYVFNEDGSFQNVLGAESYIEGWQGTTPDACGAPVFPHDGTASATYTYNAAAGTVTIDGKGAFLGLAKVINGAEITAPSEAADSITYIAVLDGNILNLDIEVAGGGFWSFKLARQ